MRRILITAVGGDVGGSILASLKDGFPNDSFIGCDIKKEVPFLSLLEAYIVVPCYDAADYAEVIMNICIKMGITHFCPTTEPEILIFNQCRNFFKQNGISLMINNSQIIEVATSKFKTSKYLKQQGILCPETYLGSAYNGELEFPIIIKPDYGRGSTGVTIVKNSAEFQQVKNRMIDNVVVQKYIGSPQDEYTVGVFSNGDQTASIAFLRTLGLGGMSVRVETVCDRALSDIAAKVAAAFQLKGAINIQLRKMDGLYYIFEINPRLSSTVGFRHKMGFQDAVWWIELLDGLTFSPAFRINPGVIGLRYLDEIIFPKDGKNLKN